MQSSHLIALIQPYENDHQNGLTFLKTGNHEHNVSYGQLYRRSSAVLAKLQQAGLKAGDQLILQIEDNEKFLYVFWACILGGIVAVPVTVGNNHEHNLKLFKIWAMLDQPYLVAYRDRVDTLRTFSAGRPEEAAMPQMMQSTLYAEELVDERDESLSSQAVIASPSEKDTAFIQFSSGSTGEPKGVVLSHENLIANLRAISIAFETTPNDSVFGWMPLTHDMGLIGCHLYPLYANINQISMQTWLFIRRPALWFQKAAEYRATILFATNFAYKFFLSSFKPAGKDQMDLRSARLLVTGAEPISPDIERDLLSVLQPYGLSERAICNVYGLAEATVGAAIPKVKSGLIEFLVDRRYLNIGNKIRECTQGDQHVLKLVDVGEAIEDCEIRIADVDGLVFEDDIIGHIQIRGKNVTKGYYKNPQATNKVMTSDGWLDTGDLGFMRKGRLVITGRVKELIIIQGQNIYPHDIERLATEVDGIQLGDVAAVGSLNQERHEEELLLFIAYTKALEQFAPLALEVRKHILEATGLVVSKVIPIRKVPKTTSGKIQRIQLADRWSSGEFDDIYRRLSQEDDHALLPANAETETETEKTILAICRELLGARNLSLHDNFKDYGMSSMLLSKLFERLNEHYPGKLKLTDIFSYPTAYQIARLQQNKKEAAIEGIEVPIEYCDPNRMTFKKYEMVLTEETQACFQHYATAEGISVHALLATVPAPILSGLAQQDHCILHMMLEEEGVVVPVSIPVAQFSDYTELCTFVNRLSKRKDLSSFFEWSELEVVPNQAPANAIRVLIYRRSLMPRTPKPSQYFEIVVELFEEGERMGVYMEFNRMLGEPFAASFVQNMSNALQALEDSLLAKES
ncbi:acyl-CoA synthetase (AMP-forming)/AMP-acid ligase II [Paenibacillus cellulosilyticus]|uniref:Acyl-CoA synthetase (AMP-forming)/AMP-acid ligase II n=1 Tax=Paenibacillus cellulosilyticus TaxID=375489 RepID=A0A2V2YZQ3_9BACL|nr:non-ribosomal peptide synthetase [Paenibacillus cellulosilyticus]PWW07332.1 acyl-CoA synthetase (AMP-forming)/AMP-acid ligase II [Paenibacillus cellulosilyticus]QKS44489.1 non-ribosomal peptide synthetase [Paenibacillus cellulosilyticus]